LKVCSVTDVHDRVRYLFLYVILTLIVNLMHVYRRTMLAETGH